jgi:hypothetical protein
VLGDLVRGLLRADAGLCGDLLEGVAGQGPGDLLTADGFVLPRADPRLGLVDQAGLGEHVQQAAQGIAAGRPATATATAQGAEQRAEDIARAGTAGSRLAASAEETAEQAAEICPPWSRLSSVSFGECLSGVRPGAGHRPAQVSADVT